MSFSPFVKFLLAALVFIGSTFLAGSAQAQTCGYDCFNGDCECTGELEGQSCSESSCIDVCLAPCVGSDDDDDDDGDDDDDDGGNTSGGGDDDDDDGGSSGGDDGGSSDGGGDDGGGCSAGAGQAGLPLLIGLAIAAIAARRERRPAGSRRSIPGQEKDPGRT